MTNEIIVAIIALVGTSIGAGSGIIINNKLITYKIVQLEKKIDKHNNVLERMIKLEGNVIGNTEDIEVMQHDSKENKRG